MQRYIYINENSGYRKYSSGLCYQARRSSDKLLSKTLIGNTFIRSQDSFRNQESIIEHSNNLMTL